MQSETFEVVDRVQAPALCALLVVLLTPLVGFAQEGLWPEGTRGVHPFAGFGGVEWGADLSAVTATWGEPDRTDDVAGGTAAALVYADTSVAGEAVSLGFLVHPERGLVRGQALFPYGDGEDCWRLYTRIRDLVYAEIPDQDPTVRVDRGPEDLSFCTAFQIGLADARSLWTDPESGSRVTLLLDLESGVLRLSYESPSFTELAGDTTSVRR